MAPKHEQLQIFIQANISVEKNLKTCQEQPHLVSGHFIKLFHKTTTCPRWPLLSGPKSSHLIQVWLYNQIVKNLLKHMNVDLKNRSQWLKANKLSLNITKNRTNNFSSTLKKKLITAVNLSYGKWYQPTK